MYRNARDLLALILYPVVLLNSLMSSSSFLVASLGYPMYSIRSYVNSDSFISSFPIWILLVSYSLIVMAKTSKTMLNNSGKSSHPCPVPNIRGTILFFTTENDVCYGFVIYVLKLMLLNCGVGEDS